MVFDFVDNCSDWTTATAPLAFTPPDFVCDVGYLDIFSLTNTNSFGYWHSPDDVIPADALYLYRARFNVMTDVTDQSLVPQIRLRANSVNLQQSDYISIESTGDGGASPLPGGTDYNLYFVPPTNDSFTMLAFDLLNFNPDDAALAQVALHKVEIDRFLLDELPGSSVVQDYTFDASTDAWTTGGAPIVFTPPIYSHAGGALALQATTNTNCFGYWQNDPTDIIIGADQLYRGTFLVSTDVTDPSAVPQMRLRFNTGNLQASRTYGVESIGDGANSPGTTNTTYDQLYFLPPANCEGENLIVSFDMLNFSPDANGSLILDQATIESLTPPDLP
jgi:hypothetical protein